MENYEKKYKTALEKSRELYETDPLHIKWLEKIFPELKESEDNRIRKELIFFLNEEIIPECSIEEHKDKLREFVSWLEQKPTESFKAEHGKYYYCVKDFYSGGCKRASKGDIIQALGGMSIMGLGDASKYFLPVNTIEWGEEDELMLKSIIQTLGLTNGAAQMKIDWLKNRLKPPQISKTII